MNFDLNYFK